MREHFKRSLPPLLLAFFSTLATSCHDQQRPGKDNENSPLLLEAIHTLGLAYASSSINTSVFREQSILQLPSGLLIAAYYDELGDVRLDTVRFNGEVIHSLRIEPRLPPQLLNDGHSVISLGRSVDGLIHAVYGAHGTAPWYAQLPEDALLTGSPSQVLATQLPWTLTYPQIYRLGEELQLWFRTDPESAIRRITYRPETGWTQNPEAILLPDAVTHSYPYMNQLATLGSRVALSWVYRQESIDDLVRNEGLYLAISTDGGASFTSGSTTTSIPIEPQIASRALSLSSDTQPLNQTASSFGSDGKIYITYYAMDEKGIHQIQLAEFDPTGRLIGTRVVSDNKASFQLAGRGTLTLPLSRPAIAVSDDFIHIIYRQGELITIASRATSDPTSGWTLTSLDAGELGSWEPTIARDSWTIDRKLILYVQYAAQGAADTAAPTPSSLARLFVLREAPH